MVEVLHRGCLTPFIVKQVLVGKSSGQVKVNPSQQVGSLSTQVGVQPLLELEEDDDEDTIQLGILQFEVELFLQQGSSFGKHKKVSSDVQSGTSPEVQNVPLVQTGVPLEEDDDEELEEEEEEVGVQKEML